MKIPITNTEGASSLDLVRRLSHEGVKLNVTALMTGDAGRGQRRARSRAAAPAFVSVFAGRIADAGRRARADHGARRSTPCARCPASS